MLCDACGVETEGGARYCHRCGAAQRVPCSRCGRALLPEAVFCSSCGKRVSHDAIGLALESARRQITVMFCDLVGATKLASALDPEELRDLVRAYQQTCVDQVDAFGGYVAQYLGDGMLVYFGWPKAQEDGPGRAVQAALGIVQELGALNGRLEREHGVRISLRIGMHTGLVVVSPMGGGDRQEELALGDTPNIAARLQALAEPDSVLISQSTADLLGGRFQLEPLGERSLRGLREPMRVYRVERETVFTRARHWRGRSPSPMVGRGDEVRQLADAWQRARAGAGVAVLLRGEPGIGKSRMAQALCESCGGERIELQCSLVFRRSAFHPFVRLLRQELDLQADEPRDARLERLRRSLPEGAGPASAAALAELLGIGEPGIRVEEDGGERALQALQDWLLARVRDGPALILWEDAHWGDASSNELIGRLIERIRDLPVLLLMTAREEFDPPWEALNEEIVRIEIPRLDPRHASWLVRRIAGRTQLPDRIVDQLVERTDGVPMFIEELTRKVVELPHWSDDGGMAPSADIEDLGVPVTLQDLLLARIDRFPHLKPVLSLAAVLGREFDVALLRDVSGQELAELEGSLRELVEADFLVQRPDGDARYLFRHALIQESAYRALLRTARRDLHRRVGQTLEARSTADAGLGEDLDLLAYHWRGAVDPEHPDPDAVRKAIRYLRQAGERGLRVSAYATASGHFDRARELLEALPDARERDEQELGLLEPVSIVLKVTRGWSSRDVKQAYDRTRTLCAALGETERLAQTLLRLWSYHLVRGEYRTSLEVAEECLGRAHELQSSDLLLQASVCMSNSLFWLCRLDEAMEYAERVLEMYEPELHDHHLVVYGQDPRIHALMFAVWVPWMQGRLQQAERNYETLLRLAEEVDHPFSTAMALNTACGRHMELRDMDALKRDARRLHDLAAEHDFTDYRMFAAAYTGWAVAYAGQAREVVESQRTLSATSRGEVGLNATQSYLGIAQINRLAGRPEDALQLVDMGLEVSERQCELTYQAELVRLKGELQAELGRSSLARRTLREGLDLAVDRGQASYALRSAMALFELARDSGESIDEARDLLMRQFEPFAGRKEADPARAARLLGGDS